MKCTNLGAREKHKPEKLRFCYIMFYRYEPGSKLVVLGMAIPPIIGNPYNGYINPYYWVDDHPLLYRNNRILDPSTYEPPMFFISTLRIFSLWESCHLLSLQVNFGWHGISYFGGSSIVCLALLPQSLRASWLNFDLTQILHSWLKPRTTRSETNEYPLKERLAKTKFHLPTIDFKGRSVVFRECIQNFNMFLGLVTLLSHLGSKGLA